MRHSLKSALAGITLLGASLIPGYFAFNRKFNPEKPKARIEAAKQSIDKQLVEELRDDSIPGYDLVRLDFSRSEQPHASGDMPAGGNGAYIHYYPNPTTGKRDIYVEVYDNEHLDKAASDTLRDFLGGALPQPSDMATMSEEDRVRACNQNLVDAIHAKGTKIVGENGQEYNMFEIGGCILLLIGGAVCLGYARKQRRKEKKPLAVEEEIVETDNLLAQEIGQVTLDFNTLYESIQQKLEGSVRDAMIMKIDFKAIKVRLSSSLSNFMDALQSMESNHNDKTPINIDLQKLKDEFANLQNIQADINILFSEGMKKEITVGMVLLEERFQTLETLMESPTALASSNFDIPQTQAFIAGQRQIIADWDNGNGMNYQGDAYTKYTAYQPILESLTIALQTVNQKVADINSLLSQPAEPAEEQPAEELEELVAEPPVAEELEELPQVPVTETRETLLARLSSTPIDQIDDMDELKDVVTGIATQIKAMLDAIQSASDSLDATEYDAYRQSTQDFLDIQTRRYAHRETEFMFIEQCKEYIVGDLQSFFMDVYARKESVDIFVQEEKEKAAKKPATDSKKPADVADLPPPPPPLLDDGGIAEITVVPEAPVTVEAVEAGGTRVATLDALYGDLDEDGRHIKVIFRRLFPDTQQDILSEDALKKLFDNDDILYQEYKSFAFNYYTLNKNYFTSLLQPCIQIYKSARDVLNNKDSYQNDFKTWLKKSRPTSLHPLGEVYCNVWQHLPNVSIDNDVLHLPDNISIGDLSNFMYGTGRDDRNVVWHFNHDKNPPEMLCPGIRVPQIPPSLRQFLISKGLQSSLDALQPIFDAGDVVAVDEVAVTGDNDAPAEEEAMQPLDEVVTISSPIETGPETSPQIKEIPTEQLHDTLHTIMTPFLARQRINDFTLALDAVDPKNLGSLSFTITTENEVGLGKLTGKKTLQTIKVTITNDSLKNGKLSSLRTEGLPDKSIGSLRSMLSSTTGTGLIADLKNTNRGINGDLLIRDGKLSISTSSASASGGSVESNTPLSPEAGDGQGGGDETGDGGESVVESAQTGAITELAGGTLLTTSTDRLRRLSFLQMGVDFTQTVEGTPGLGFIDRHIGAVTAKVISGPGSYEVQIDSRLIRLMIISSPSGGLEVEWHTLGAVMANVPLADKETIDRAIGSFIHYRYDTSSR